MAQILSWIIKITVMKRILLTTALLLGFLFQGNAQRFDYENTSKLFFGINAGGTWHTSDVKNVKNRLPLGAGFIFGGTLNQDYGKAVSFDIRFRYLGGNWYGQDRDTTSAIQNNHAVNALYDTLGYTVQNFKATQHRVALELSIHANRFKERTGFDPYIFAGIGVTSTRTKGDLLKKTDNLSNGVIYPYNQSPNGNIIDKDYTVALDKNEAGEFYDNERFETNILPSLGFGIGYYVNSRLSIGLEHKSTFFLADYFDGTTLNQDGMPSDKFENDIYHYSGLYLKWYLKSSKKDRVPQKNDPYIPPTKPQTPAIENESGTDDPGRKRPPIVTFNNPSSTPFRTSTPTFAIRANVQFINNANQLRFTRNGENHSTFIFNPMAQRFESSVNLDLGENVFTLVGTNSDGTDSDRVVIIYERKVDDRSNPPKVNIVDPVFRPHTVNQLNYILKADIQNISARNQLTVTFNDQPFSDFSFSPSGNINFNANLRLNPGINKFKIVGTNEGGTAQDEAVIIYTREANDNTGYPPVVKITTPSLKPYTTTQASEKVVAKIENVNSKQQIDVKINSVSTTNFIYNTTTKLVELGASLTLGTNTITITAVNPYGKDADETQIIYRRGEVDNNPPKVKILAPSTNPYNTNQESVNIIAEVENINNKSQIEVKVNGVNTTAFSFNSTTKLIQFSQGLIIGSNTISIKVTNPYGKDTDQTQVIYRVGGNDTGITGPPPTVKFITPNTNPYTTEELITAVIAQVLNIDKKQQIEVKINGVKTSNFTFNSSTKLVNLNPSLTEGNNRINIKVTNLFGSDIAETQIILRKKTVGKPPVVNFVYPNATQKPIELPNFKMVAKVENITEKSGIELYFNGKLVNGNNYSFNSTLGTVQYESNLIFGMNTYIINVRNDFGSDQATARIERIREKAKETGGIQVKPSKPLPCIKPSISITSPGNYTTKTESNNFNVQGQLKNLENTSGIKVYLNGKEQSNYIFNSITTSFSNNIQLDEGENIYLIKLTNKCGTVEKKYIINYEIPQGCGVNIDLGSLTSDFCLSTDAGTVTRSDLMTNSNYVYKGVVKSLYFKAAENGTVTVNGSDYPLVKDNFYHFIGSVTVDIGKNKAGSKGKWNICVESRRVPMFGKGNTKPKSPCETENNNVKKPNVRKDIPNINKKPDLKETPIIKGQPDVKEAPSGREIPTRNDEKAAPRQPASREGVNVRGGR